MTHAHNRSPRHALVLALLAGTSIAGCNADLPIDDSTAYTEEAIINGTVVPHGSSSTVLLAMPPRGSSLRAICSGVALRNSWVLTTEHCWLAGEDAVPGDTLVSVDGAASSWIPADAIVLHPTYDLALVHLPRPLTIDGSTTGANVPFLTTGFSDLMGTPLECLGFGNNSATGGAGTTLRSGMMQVTGLAPNGIHFWTGAGPSGQLQADGDSGGGCFDGDWLAGISQACYSYGCTVLSVHAFAGWARSTMREAWSQPNDARAQAIPIRSSSAERTVTGSTRNATHDAPPVTCQCTGGADVWYSFTVSQREIVYLDTAGSSFDTSIVVTNASGVPVSSGCNDDAFCGGTGGFTSIRESRLATWLDPGTYYVAVGGCTSGDFTLHLQRLRHGMATWFLPNGLSGTGVAPHTYLSGTGRMTPTCSPGPSAEDARWFMACGGESTLFSVCPGDGGGFQRSRLSVNYDPVLMIRSARAADEPWCNDDAPASAMINCTGFGGDSQPYGARIQATVGRGLHAIVVDERAQTEGMDYDLRFQIP